MRETESECILLDMTEAVKTGRQLLADYIQLKGYTRAQAAHHLRVSPSCVQYWLTSSKPRKVQRTIIELLTDGAVPQYIDW